MTRNLQAHQQLAGAHREQYGNLELVAHYGDSIGEYHAALNAAVVLDTSHHGRIVLRDRDRAALLQRLSTNDIEHLSPGQGARTVLTNHNGRIIDLLTVYVLADELLVVTGPGQGSQMIGLLRKNIFFNDKVKLEDTGSALFQCSLYGPDSARMLSDLTSVDVTDLPLHAIRSVAVDALPFSIARSLPLGGNGFDLFCPADQQARLWGALVHAGARPMGQEAFEYLRVEAGYAAWGRELSLEYIPLETGLWDAVSFTKGCYVGQEIIARMESRKRMAKQLRGLHLSGILAAPTSLQVEGKDAGDLTSVVESPRFGPIGLAYVRTAYGEPGTTVGIVDSNITGKVVALPFTAA